MLTVKIDPEKIGKLIGPGGKNIKALQADTGTNIDIEEDGTVFIASTDAAGAERCRDIIEAMMAEVKVGKIYNGRVVSIKDFGAFIEIAPDTDGLCHVSELSDRYVERVTDVINMGDEVKVKVVLIDDTGRIKLSRKQAMIELGESDPEPVGAPAGGGGGDRGGEQYDRGGPRPGGDRGPRRDGGGWWRRRPGWRPRAAPRRRRWWWRRPRPPSRGWRWRRRPHPSPPGGWRRWRPAGPERPRR